MGTRASGRQHRDTRDLLAAYVLDALSPGELAEVLTHVSACRECSAMAVEFRHIAGWVALGVTPRTPGPELRIRVLAGATPAWEEVGALA